MGPQCFKNSGRMLSGPYALQLWTWLITKENSLMEKGVDKRPFEPWALQRLLLSCFTEKLCFLSASLKLPSARSRWAMELGVTGQDLG